MNQLLVRVSSRMLRLMRLIRPASYIKKTLIPVPNLLTRREMRSLLSTALDAYALHLISPEMLSSCCRHINYTPFLLRDLEVDRAFLSDKLNALRKDDCLNKLKVRRTSSPIRHYCCGMRTHMEVVACPERPRESVSSRAPGGHG